MDEFTITLNSPLTEEQWDMIADYDFEHTDRIWFHTKHGKEVEFVKRKTGKWINANDGKWNTVEVLKCSACGEMDNRMYRTDKYCPNCGAKMEGSGI